MTLVVSTVPNLIQGVSQQPPSLRGASQAVEMDDCYPSVVDGLQKRHPTEHIAKIIDGDAGDAKIHVINRDPTERYVVAIRDSDVKVFETDGTEVPVHGPTGPAYTPDFATYLLGAEPADLRCLTVADYTFVLNRTKVTALDAATTPTQPFARKAFLFVKAGNYVSNYRVSIRQTGGNWRTASVSTWTGSAAVDQQSMHSMTITSVGTVGQLWEITFPGAIGVAGYTVQPGDTIEDVGEGLRNAINSLDRLTAWGTGSGFTYQAIEPLTDITPTGILFASTGTYVTSQEVVGSVNALQSIKTDDIAALLARKLGNLPGTTAEAIGSVIRLETAGDLLTLDVSDSAGDSTLQRIWMSVDAISDLPTKFEDGMVVKIDGATEDAADDYYVEFVGDTAGAFGSGRWQETLGHARQYQIDADTMPWLLIRKQDDVLGTVTGTPSLIYFEWAQAEWTDCLVGDEETNGPPSFIGHPLADIFFFRNRLGVLADQNVILTEVGRYFQFWRTTVTTLLDSDPIDVSAAHVVVAELHAAVPFDERLILFSGRTQFVLTGDPLLTPKTASITPVLEYENVSTIRPVSTARGLLFGYKQGTYSGVREMLPLDSDDLFTADPVTSHVPRFISGALTDFATSTLEGILVCRAEGDTNVLYVWKYYWSGAERLQSAWGRFTFGEGAEVVGFDFIENTLYLAIQRTEGLFLENMTIAPGQADDNSTYVTYLDRRITDDDCTLTYDIVTNRTTIELPYEIEDNVTMQVVTRCTEPDNGGNILTVITASGEELVVYGDQTAAALWIGQKYVSRYQFSHPELREATSERGRGVIVGGRWQMRFGTIVYDRTAAFTVRVTPLNRDTYAYPFGRVLGSGNNLIGEVALESGKFRFPLLAKNDELVIVVENDSPLPSNLQSAEWEGTYYSKSTRS